MFSLRQTIELDGKAILERLMFKTPMRYPGTMENEACFVYTLNGHATVHGEFGTDSIVTDESALMNCGRFINSWHNHANGGQNEVVVIHLYPSIIKKIYEDGIPDFLKKKSHKTNSNVQPLKRQEAISNYINGLIFYFDNPSLTDEEFIKLKLRELLVILHNTNNPGIKGILSDLFDEHQLGFREVIQNNMYKSLSLDELAYLCNLSLSSFKRKFKDTFGASPASYIRDKKLVKAEGMIKHTDQSITDICYDSGFNDSKSFAKNFKAKYGSSPSSYRKNLKA